MKKFAFVLTSALVLSTVAFATTDLNLNTISGGRTVAEKNMSFELREKLNVAKTYVLALQTADILTPSKGYFKDLKVLSVKSADEYDSEVTVKLQYLYNDGVNGNTLITDTVLVRDNSQSLDVHTYNTGHQVAIVDRIEKSLDL